MRFLNISCKKAGFLLSKKEENKLTWLEKIQLKGHITICSLCRRFEEQTGWIILNAKHAHTHSEATLSEETKTRLQNLITD